MWRPESEYVPMTSLAELLGWFGGSIALPETGYLKKCWFRVGLY